MPATEASAAPILFYLVRPRNACGPGSLGFDADGAERSPGAECPL